MHSFLIFSAIIGIVLIVVLAYKVKNPQGRIDDKQIRHRILLRILFIVTCSLLLYIVMNPRYEGTILKLNGAPQYYIYGVVIFMSVLFLFMDKLYDIIGPVKGKRFAHSLSKNKFALYLRNFQMDQECTYNGTEQLICETLNQSLPVFAIGNPFEVLPSIGAERLYATDEEWEDIVQILLQRSRLVLIRPALSPGCIKELSFCSQYDALNKTIFLIRSQEDIEIICDKLKIQNTSRLLVWAKTLVGDKDIGVRIQSSGQYEAFDINKLDTYLGVLLGIDTYKTDSPQLSIGETIYDKIAFFLNPFFYSGIHKWPFLFTLLSFCFMVGPAWFLYRQYVCGDMLEYMDYIFFIEYVLFVYFTFQSHHISLVHKAYSSVFHYRQRNTFLIQLSITLFLMFAGTYSYSCIFDPILRVYNNQFMELLKELINQILLNITYIILEWYHLLCEFIFVTIKMIYATIIIIIRCFPAQSIVFLFICILILFFLYKKNQKKGKIKY